MLKEPLFKVFSIDHNEDTVRANLEINQACEIFEGHFPGQPVVPGASMLQTVKEILEKALNKPLRLTKADNIKFLSLVEPNAIKVLQLELAYKLLDDHISVTANLMADDTVCMKLQGRFIINRLLRRGI